jgi:hypothetical protein
MTLARTARANEQRIFVARDKGAGCEVEDKAAIHLRVEVEIETVERSIGIAEAGLLAPALQQTIGRRVSSSDTRQASKSMGAIGSACA